MTHDTHEPDPTVPSDSIPPIGCNPSIPTIGGKRQKKRIHIPPPVPQSTEHSHEEEHFEDESWVHGVARVLNAIGPLDSECLAMDIVNKTLDSLQDEEAVIRVLSWAADRQGLEMYFGVPIHEQRLRELRKQRNQKWWNEWGDQEEGNLSE